VRLVTCEHDIVAICGRSESVEQSSGATITELWCLWIWTDTGLQQLTALDLDSLAVRNFELSTELWRNDHNCHDKSVGTHTGTNAVSWPAPPCTHEHKHSSAGCSKRTHPCIRPWH
jgi:hypothetical protein